MSPQKNLGPIEIRGATPADAPAVANLSAQLGYPSPVSELQERLEDVVDSHEQAVFVACWPANTVVGWVHVFVAQRIMVSPFAELGGFVVAEHYRRRGIGKLLLKAAEDWAVQKRVPKLRVRSNVQRADAKAFYEQLGFSVMKEQRVFDKSLS